MSTNTTTRLRLTARRLDRPPIIVTIAIAVVLLVSMAIGAVRYTPTQAPAVPTASLPIVIIATAQPVATPAGITVADAKPVRWVTAFASPGGDVLGPVPMPETSAIVARFGDEWYEIVWESGPAWIRASELGMEIADVKPERVIIVSAPAEPSYQTADAAAPTPPAPVMQPIRHDVIRDHFLGGIDPNARAP